MSSDNQDMFYEIYAMADSCSWPDATFVDSVYAQFESRASITDAQRRVHQILEGTNEIMRLIISRSILGN